MSNKSNAVVTALLNGFYFLVVFVVALAFTTLSLARRLNSYDANHPDQTLVTTKDSIALSNVVAGQIDKILVKEGQSVKKGELLLTLTDEVSDAKIASLESVARDNISARTEAQVLRAQAGYFEITAPENGVIYSINSVEGTYLSNPTKLIEIFADNDVKLVGHFTPTQYTEILKQPKLDVYNNRLEQIFEVNFTAVSQVIEENDQSKYELLFTFSNPEDAASFVQGEKVTIVARSRDDQNLRPEEMIKKFWNSFILGPQQVTKPY